MELFASRLRERAAELGLPHAEIARRSGLSERRYANYVSGIREPDLATLVRIAEALETTADALLGIGETGPASERSQLLDRLLSAARVLTDQELEMVVLQTEAVVTHSRRRSPSG